MQEMLNQSLFFGLVISILGYELGRAVQKKWRLAILNPLLISIIFVIVVLKILHIDYNTYNASAKYLNYLLTPSTVCLAIPFINRYSF